MYDYLLRALRLLSETMRDLCGTDLMVPAKMITFAASFAIRLEESSDLVCHVVLYAKISVQAE